MYKINYKKLLLSYIINMSIYNPFVLFYKMKILIVWRKRGCYKDRYFYSCALHATDCMLYALQGKLDVKCFRNIS